MARNTVWGRLESNKKYIFYWWICSAVFTIFVLLWPLNYTNAKGVEKVHAAPDLVPKVH